MRVQTNTKSRHINSRIVFLLKHSSPTCVTAKARAARGRVKLRKDAVILKDCDLQSPCKASKSGASSTMAPKNKKESDYIFGVCPHGCTQKRIEPRSPYVVGIFWYYEHMNFEQSQQNPKTEVIEKTSNDRQFAYKREVGELIKERPGILKDALNLIAEAEKLDVGKSIDEDDIKVTYFQERNWSHNFKVEVNDKSFFVRKELGRGTGFKAIRGFKEAAQRIEGKEDVRLIDYQLGYTDKMGNDYFVAKWENLPVMGDYLSRDLPDEERKFIAQKLEYVYDTFKDYDDVTTGNMFYDPEKKQIVLFDLEKQDIYDSNKG
ncbi:MAG: hypothetical protein G01um101429_56 [Parcubacteria group bacterium Gr01-1014_29]|nr:MAG: hypothetical protein G01um101429_56 [Parcubacteria group bacterium Gr01-1014_29]